MPQRIHPAADARRRGRGDERRPLQTADEPEAPRRRPSGGARRPRVADARDPAGSRWLLLKIVAARRSSTPSPSTRSSCCSLKQRVARAAPRRGGRRSLVNWIYFSRKRIAAAKYLTPGIILLSSSRSSCRLHRLHRLHELRHRAQQHQGRRGRLAHALRARARRGLADLRRHGRRAARRARPARDRSATAT